MVVRELYRYNGEWKFNVAAAGFSGGSEHCLAIPVWMR
ncbi:hypothetical protein PUT07_31215 [Paenibacillus sp. MAHUQ-63]|nr:hypothetical protein [Paenibacillus sp. MAHUQ-63]MDD9271536.1 hypothetical protein [Paenibacillus sp. MAHUQ-63]